MDEAETVSLRSLEGRPAPMAGLTWKAYAAQTVSPGILLRDMAEALKQAGRPAPVALEQALRTWESLSEARWPWRRRRVGAAVQSAIEADIRYFEALVGGGLPPSSFFTAQIERLKTCRRALLNGTREDDVLEHGKAERALRKLTEGAAAPENWRIELWRAPAHDGLMLAKWKMEFAPAAGRSSMEADLCQRELIALLCRIARLQNGFEIDKLRVGFRGGGNAGWIVGGAEVTGLLPVAASE